MRYVYKYVQYVNVYNVNVYNVNVYNVNVYNVNVYNVNVYNVNGLVNILITCHTQINIFLISPGFVSLINL